MAYNACSLKLALIWPLLIALGTYDLGADSMKGPEEVRLKPLTSEVGSPSWMGQKAVGFFQKVISPADGPRSPSYPTGSAYAWQVLGQEGFFWGLLMTGDRLFHEADLPLGPMVEIHAKQRFYDPPRYNRYWRE
ncbi:MAG: hypothetical protein A2508_02925 [Candidatus Lambdaproteobacteria bacterium RIFOXYD12_FULL_49_8]|uniref:Uncharacterized protein n=1 Tax=Candidatus Lambdaproteobacteria bacterium RIFOXYD2_FULL_50_16 TaxID=1817772 RepID=A0A1F6GDK6_9PROT|nr:MAG: hypothetical protein A2527_04625 [Candidatus Lambdaproteobacteria bacterium RIFOXYD2_FULL_50_16]OGG98124.1 MAG: hypothetical protein A2508_02925 [Candidatus Lambdaproteobacteria bacterium RIFOXYD12_FULL_49_8]